MASLSRIIPKRPLRTLSINNAWVSRRCNATLTEVAPDGPAVTATNRAEATLKRFWTTVGIASTNEGNGTDVGGYHITLDNRPLRTPGGARLVVPERKQVLAALVAKEWEDQETLIKPHALPMTSIVSRAIDAMYDEETKAGVRAALLKYLDTDTICFHQTEPEQLVRLQSEHWHPLLQWAKDEFGIELLTFDSILSVPQPAETVAKLDVVLQGMSAWELAAMERATYATKSFIVALALVKRRINAEQAALAAQAEVDSQIERWGEVEDSHDVDHQDVRRQLGSAALVLSNC